MYTHTHTHTHTCVCVHIIYIYTHTHVHIGKHGKGKGKGTGGASTVIPALIEKATGRVDESAVFIAVEFLYKFWDGVSSHEHKVREK